VPIASGLVSWRLVAYLEIRGVKKAFGKKRVFSNVDLSIRRGETLSIIGPSGCGKSVLLKMIVGLLEPDEGQIVFDDEDVTAGGEEAFVRLRRRVAMLFQGAALFDSLTVFENVAYGLREQRKLDEDQIRARVAESLAYVGLPGIEEMWPAALSGGMRKRVGLARSIASHPEVMLYDEPTTGLDPVNVERINRLIRHLAAQLSLTSIVVTHDFATVRSVSDRVAMLDQGAVRFVGTYDELARCPDDRVRAFVNGDPSFDAAIEETFGRKNA
jgi:phospholipid/cholesterol/gamma-HCH transport system ATP-binding protein